jgi:hypothetical protein
MGRPPLGRRAMSGAERTRRYRATLRASKPPTKPLTISRRDAAQIVAMANELALARKAIEQLESERHSARYARLLSGKVQLSVTLYDLLLAYAQTANRRARRKK